METIIFLILTCFSAGALVSCVKIHSSDTYFRNSMWFMGETPHLNMPKKMRTYCIKHGLLDKEERVTVSTMEYYKFHKIQLPAFISLVICSVAANLITRYCIGEYGLEFLDPWYIIVPVANLFFSIYVCIDFILHSHDNDTLDPTKDGKQHPIHWLMRLYTLALILSVITL